jgi:hypothetical protein
MWDAEPLDVYNDVRNETEYRYEFGQATHGALIKICKM